jgi:hypothetical protein
MRDFRSGAYTTSGVPDGVSLLLSIALPSFVDSIARAYRLKAGNAAWKVSTTAGTTPMGRRESDAPDVERNQDLGH